MKKIQVFVCLALAFAAHGLPNCTILWMAPFYSGGGYCSEATSFAAILAEQQDSQGFKFAISQQGDSFNQDYINGLTEEERLLLSPLDRTAQRVPSSKTNPLITICHSEPGSWHAPTPAYQTFRCPPASSTYRIGRTMFETDRIPSGWPRRLNTMDEIWVPTEFSRQIFQDNGVDAGKLVVVGEPVNTNFYRPSHKSTQQCRQELARAYPNLRELFKDSPSSTIFLFVGKWERRKGVRTLIRAYLEQFTADDSVGLLFITNAYHSSSDFERQIEKIIQEEGGGISIPPATNRAKYAVLSQVPQALMPIVYSASNALVIPSHGEGWGRPHVEAMSCALPVVATNWSGPTEYLNERNGFPLRYNGLVPNPDWNGHLWADVSIDHLKETLRSIQENPEEARKRGQRARQDMIDNYSFEAMRDSLLAEFTRIRMRLSSAKSKKAINDEL